MQDFHDHPATELPSRVSLATEREIGFWTERFDVSREQLICATRAVGHSARFVERYLKRPALA